MASEGLDITVLDREPTEMMDLSVASARKSPPKLVIPVKKDIKLRKKKMHWKGIDASKVANTLWAENDDNFEIQLDGIFFFILIFM